MCGRVLERHAHPVRLSFIPTLRPHSQHFPGQVFGMLFLLQAILCGTVWVSCRSVPFQHELESVQNPQVKDSVPRHRPHFRCQLQVGSPQVTHIYPTWLHFEVPMTSLFRFHPMLEQLTELGETLPYVHPFII